MKGTFRRVSISSYKNKKRETNSSTVRQPLLSQKPLTDKDETNRSEEVMESGSSHQISPCKKFQQHHGIPAVPMAKRSANEVLIRPVVYVDCEFDASIELPFGEDSIAANIRDIRRREKEREASARYLQWCLYASLALLLLVAAWYIVSAVQIDLGLSLQVARSDSVPKLTRTAFLDEVNKIRNSVP
ncbi:expressed unknown protein [Seminavis robusta]|uniref:Uncharacterized protein n=1 Tax=Seminavis robusta TaxID=568900 RepID=A0A9N8HWJ9_9STRA|nr:expressed unknown protein [Seminavis robusta]|eukprot:Sro1988_g309650.1 n/a (187) ;mRNA; f:11184-11744